jgi:hypothetical protein
VELAIEALEIVVTGLDGDDLSAVRLATQLEATARALDRVDIFVETGVMVGAASLINLARPADALTLIDCVAQFREVYRLADFRAVAHLALSQTGPAVALIREHANRALSGRLQRETSDSVVMLAALADSDGDRGHATELLLHTGMWRSVVIGVLARGFARRWELAEEYRQREQACMNASNTSADGLLGADLGMTTLKQEMTQRGWL